MNKQTCGYQGHYCSGVKFISRYHDTNDYCVNGRRVSLTDSGWFSDASSTEEREAIRLFLLNEYADYLKWHSEHKTRLDLAVIAPFTSNCNIY